ncbi:MAG: hypothetical protein DDT19_00539 [Syntrophomonadaceae bacterium]|nr:hypothetical protein [Bacillota bacterium]
MDKDLYIEGTLDNYTPLKRAGIVKVIVECEDNPEVIHKIVDMRHKKVKIAFAVTAEEKSEGAGEIAERVDMQALIEVKNMLERAITVLTNSTLRFDAVKAGLGMPIHAGNPDMGVAAMKSLREIPERNILEHFETRIEGDKIIDRNDEAVGTELVAPSDTDDTEDTEDITWELMEPAYEKEDE